MIGERMDGRTNRRTEEQVENITQKDNLPGGGLTTMANQSMRAYAPDDAEEIDVGVVDGEVDEDGARAAVDPQIVLQVLDHVLGFVACQRQYLSEPAAAVLRDLSVVARSIQLIVRHERPTVRQQQTQSINHSS